MPTDKLIEPILEAPEGFRYKARFYCHRGGPPRLALDRRSAAEHRGKFCAQASVTRSIWTKQLDQKGG